MLLSWCPAVRPPAGHPSTGCPGHQSQALVAAATVPRERSDVAAGPRSRHNSPTGARQPARRAAWSIGGPRCRTLQRTLRRRRYRRCPSDGPRSGWGSPRSARRGCSPDSWSRPTRPCRRSASVARSGTTGTCSTTWPSPPPDARWRGAARPGSRRSSRAPAGADSPGGCPGTRSPSRPPGSRRPAARRQHGAPLRVPGRRPVRRLVGWLRGNPPGGRPPSWPSWPCSPGPSTNLAPFPTSLALLGILVAALAAAHDRRVLLVVGLAVAVVSYSTAVFAGLGLIVGIVIASWEKGPRTVVRNAVWGLVGFGSLAALALHDQLTFHHWNAYSLVQDESNRTFSLPGTETFDLIVRRTTRTQLLIGHTGAWWLAVQAVVAIAPSWPPACSASVAGGGPVGRASTSFRPPSGRWRSSTCSRAGPDRSGTGAWCSPRQCPRLPAPPGLGHGTAGGRHRGGDGLRLLLLLRQHPRIAPAVVRSDPPGP